MGLRTTRSLKLLPLLASLSSCGDIVLCKSAVTRLTATGQHCSIQHTVIQPTVLRELSQHKNDSMPRMYGTRILLCTGIQRYRYRLAVFLPPLVPHLHCLPPLRPYPSACTNRACTVRASASCSHAGASRRCSRSSGSRGWRGASRDRAPGCTSNLPLLPQ